MRVVKVIDPKPGRPRVSLVDTAGNSVAVVDEFLRLLAVREYSPNTVRAYAHDLQKLFLFFDKVGLSAADFTPARAMEFPQWLRLLSSSRRAQRLESGIANSEGRVLSAKTCNRVMAAVSSFYEFMIASEVCSGRENPIVKVTDHAGTRVPEEDQVEQTRHHGWSGQAPPPRSSSASGTPSSAKSARACFRCCQASSRPPRPR